MKIGMEMMAQTIFLCIACVILAQIIGSNLYMMEARTYFHKLADQIECSQNDTAVLKQCKKEAKEKGYRLESKKIETAQGDSCLLLSLYYEMKLPQWGSEDSTGETAENKKREGVIQGYAR